MSKQIATPPEPRTGAAPGADRDLAPLSELHVLELVYGAVLDPTRWRLAAEQLGRLIAADALAIAERSDHQPLNIFAISGATRRGMSIVRRATSAQTHAPPASADGRIIYRSTNRRGGTIVLAAWSATTRLDAQLPRIDRLLSAIVQSVALHRHVGAVTDSARRIAGVFQAVGHPAIAVTRMGRVVLVGGDIEPPPDDAFGVRVENGFVVTNCHENDQKLHEAIRTVIDRKSSRPVLQHLADRYAARPCSLRVTPLLTRLDDPLTGKSERLALIEVILGPKPSIVAAAVAKTCGLTPAETRVLALVLARRTPAQIAHGLGRRLETIRSQIKSILDKTGRRRQPELIGWCNSRFGAGLLRLPAGA